ncbi:MAG: hypothetical protein H6Q69_1265 [Firmicutes bacterium]|nr:hypothetical protein [Bacillota bacterium]
MTYKRFTRSMIVYSLAIFLVNVILWNTLTIKVFEQEKVTGHGDLARLGYFKVAPAITQQREKSSYTHIEFADYIRGGNFNQQIDVLTIGDSIFNGVGGSYFQDILASDYKYNVLNVGTMPDYNALEMVAVLLNSGYLDRISPKVIIVESIERECIKRYGERVDFSSSKYQVSKEQVDQYFTQESIVKPNTSSIFDERMYEANRKYLTSMFNMLTNKGNLTYMVKYTKLTKPLFSNPGQETLLLYYYEDERNIKNVDKQKVQNVNDNLNTISEMVGNKKIQFSFLLAVDKYDLYSKFIANKAVTDNPLFPYMRELEKNYIFIDTKNILDQEVTKGEKDIYWLDDTHWTWKGQEKVANQLVKRFNF